jgi:hyperosmotically inducible protein
MQRKTDEPGKPYPNILPGVLAAFFGAIFVVACDRPDSPRMTAETATRSAPAAAGVTAPAPATPAAEASAAPPRPANAMPTSEALTDPVITGRIKSALLGDPGMAGADVSVNTDRGVVSLAGTVKSHEQTGIASAHAQRQDGVVRVDNHLAMNTR